MSAENSLDGTNDAITLGNGKNDTVTVRVPSGATITLGNGAGDVVNSIDSGYNSTITLGNGADDTVSFAGGSNTIKVGNGDGDVVNDSGSGNTSVHLHVTMVLLSVLFRCAPLPPDLPPEDAIRDRAREHTRDLLRSCPPAARDFSGGDLSAAGQRNIWLGNQDSERIGHISTRLYVNGLQSTGSCSLNVFEDIIKEHNAVCRHSDCPNNIVVRLGFGLSQPNRRRHVDLFEIGENAGKLL